MRTWGEIRKQVLERDGYKCVLCGRETSGQTHHLVSRKRGGGKELSNLVTLCGRCHILLSPVPRRVISIVWGIPMSEIEAERLKVAKMMRKFIEKRQLAREPNP